jgi:L-rhamnose-H+ transport protein
MTGDVGLGIFLTFMAGLFAGNCMLPAKFVRHWQWENVWLVFNLVSLVVLPWLFALLFVGNVRAVYLSLTSHQLAIPFLFGVGWGVAQILFGLSIARLGLALGYAIIIGFSAVLGTFVPLFFKNRDILGTSKGNLILTGMVVMVAGIIVAGWAGRQRERRSSETPNPDSTNGYASALTLAIICGLTAPMLNYSFAFGQDIAQEAVRRGSSLANASYAILPVSLAGGFLPNLFYSLYLLGQKKSWSFFSPVKPDLYFGSLMGLLWTGAFALYGMSAAYIGTLGTSVGWALYNIFMIMTANVSGMVTGEWKNASSGTLALLSSGLVLLTFATILIALGNR